MMSDSEVRALLIQLYSARLESLKSLCVEKGIPKNGSVEQIRARLIKDLILTEWKFDWSSIQSYSKQDLSRFLSTFGIKRSGSIKEQRQRLWLHLNCDLKYHSLDNLDNLTRDELHELCIHLELPRSGSKSQLFGRVAGVLASQDGGWGQVKRSLRRPKGGKSNIKIPKLTTNLTSSEPKLNPIIAEDEHIEEEDVIQNDAVLDEKISSNDSDEVIVKDEIENYTNLREEIERFLSDTTEKWSVELETRLYSKLTNLGFPLYLPELSSELHKIVDELIEFESEPEIIEIKQSIENVEEAYEIANLDSRNAELDNSIRDFLEDGDLNDQQDVNAFIMSLENLGIKVDMPIVRKQISQRILEMKEIISLEKSSALSNPKNWRERNALRKLERLRPHLLIKLEEIIRKNSENIVRARVEFESLASEEGLDLSISGISGRLHGLFDLHIELNAHLLREDPTVLRREKALAIINHNSLDLPESGRNSLLRLERNIEGFEQVVDVILRKNFGEFNETQQTLLIRFLEQRGYEANQEEIRPRILGAAGVLGVEMGHISPEKIPNLGPENLVVEAQMDSVISEIKKIVNDFESEKGINIDEDNDPIIPQHHLDKIDLMRIKLNSADEILDKIGARGQEK
ncbi:MAG: hypothetical protein CMB56_001560 [Methanobacteriota archaeon]|nr:MAG: hypothetical protein CMB56_001560 [Euryarchaeota archaeon]